MHALAQCHGHSSKEGLDLFPNRLSNDLKFTISILAAAVTKSQEVEGLMPSKPFRLSRIMRAATELNQPCLRGI